MKHRASESFECLLYIGSRRGYHGDAFTREHLCAAIQAFQNQFPAHRHPVRVSDRVTFLDGDYAEDGWEVAAITYANRDKNCVEVQEAMFHLAAFLLDFFGQNRITIRSVPGGGVNTVTLEADSAENWTVKFQKE